MPAASEARRSMAPPSSERRPLLPKEDQRRGEAAAEGGMLDGVLDPLSNSLQRLQSINSGCCDLKNSATSRSGQSDQDTRFAWHVVSDTAWQNNQPVLL